MENHSFEYTYSPQRQREIEEIRKAYLPKEEDKMTELRRLHAIPTQKAQTLSLTVGIIGLLILGTGMSLCMTELGAALGSLAMVLGILVDLAGLAMVAVSYPLYRRTLEQERAKIAPEIIRLTDELLR
ncbi:MAG: hypothetical protein IJY40_04395 [Oscillospiraceae bacterium]|nr:hypothetical protein [Oscillospiraceae bacterium]